MPPETVPIRKDDLDTLVAACTSYLPADASPEVIGALKRAVEAWSEPDGIGEEVPASAALGDGQFMEIAFVGHIEREGYVTEITLGGEPGYRIDLPDKLWGGNPYAWEEYSAKVLFGRWPVREEPCA